MNTNIKRRGIMLVLSSPSGAGKTTISKMLVKEDNNLNFSISATTRSKRPEEVDGVDYFFKTKEEFKNILTENGFLEYATVFNNLYGTPKKDIEDKLSNGQDVIFDIDWQGTHQLTQNSRNDVVSIFILPPSKEELRHRLQSRNQDNSEEIEYRMAKSDSEISHWYSYDYVIINNSLNDSLKAVQSIIQAERLKRTRQTGLSEFIEKLLHEKQI